MVASDRKISNLQSEIDKIGSGYCLSFKLLNCDELNFMLNRNIDLINRLDKIIQKVCCNSKIESYLEYLVDLNNKELVSFDEQTTTTSIYRQIEHDRILLVLPDKPVGFAKEVALKVYFLSQLYIDDKFPVIYMNCCIASVEFPKVSHRAEEIYNLLNCLLAENNNNYYREYTQGCCGVEFVQESNKNLNLLRKALLKRTMVFAYQPVIDSETMEIHYYECLLRIPDANDNLVSVGLIIPEAEKKGLIFIVDQIVLEMAIKELVANPKLVLAVNISNIGTLDPPLLVMAEKLLQKYNVSKRLIIEITETSLNQNYDQVASFMYRLRAFGCRFALDDFGSGFTSFKQLQNLPIDIIKIDGSYVRNVVNDLQSQDFIARLVKISKNLGTQTIAEFVENGEIARFLINLKVDGMQGNFFYPASTNRISELYHKSINTSYLKA